MNTFDLTRHINRVEQQVLSVDNFESSEEAYSELNNAEKAYFRYKKMFSLVKKLEEVNEDLCFASDEYDLMTEEDYCDDLEHSSVDAINALKQHIQKQVHIFEKYCKDLEGAAIDMSGEEADVRRFGSYQDQVRNQYYSTR